MRLLTVVLSLIVVTAACGDDDGNGAADASPPDAVSFDANTTDGGMNTSPFTLITCAAGPDAGTFDAGIDGGMADAGVDAGMADAGVDASMADASPASDAGPPPNLDDPCCNPTGECSGNLACIDGPTASEHRCRTLCDLSTRSCPFGGVCASFSGQGVCIPAGGIGDDCAPELCAEGGICVGSTAENAVCEQKCEMQSDCTSGTCTAVGTGGSMACL